MGSFHFVRGLLLAAHFASAVTVTSLDSQQRIVRRQQSSVELTSEGSIAGTSYDTIVGSHDASREEQQPGADYNGTYSVHGSFPSSLQASNPAQFPSFDYIKGEKNTNTCAYTTMPTSVTDEPVQVPIIHKAMCKYAAENTPGARLPTLYPGDFALTVNNANDKRQKRPVGCFAELCPDSAARPDAPSVCYYWNEFQGTPTNIDGAYRICLRHTFVNGTATAGDTDAIDKGCPNNYERVGAQNTISKHDECRQAGNQIGYCEGSPFLTGDPNERCVDEILTVEACRARERAKHNDHPVGCYIAPLSDREWNGDGCVYYNAENSEWDGNPTNIGELSGTPICKVEGSAKTVWNAATDFR